MKFVFSTKSSQIVIDPQWKAFVCNLQGLCDLRCAGQDVLVQNKYRFTHGIYLPMLNTWTKSFHVFPCWKAGTQNHSNE